MKNAHISNDSFLKRVGYMISRLRIGKNIKQEQMAKELNITQPALSKYERGKIDIPILKLKEISDKYDYPMEDFFSASELPSEMYRKIVKAPTAKKPYKEDKVFNDYMLDPTNRKKREVLRAAYVLSLNGVLIDMQREDVRQLIETPDNYTDMQNKRLFAYFVALSKLAEK
ncbi:MAG: helix-turn-helix transcriptional regulator [Butyrivibrio sp.]|nr:helix-turn-helix transcriptional regulator [Butyrivibrio sp.]